jgi:hypothetical protein
MSKSDSSSTQLLVPDAPVAIPRVLLGAVARFALSFAGIGGPCW